MGPGIVKPYELPLVEPRRVASLKNKEIRSKYPKVTCRARSGGAAKKTRRAP